MPRAAVARRPAVAPRLLRCDLLQPWELVWLSASPSSSTWDSWRVSVGGEGFCATSGAPPMMGPPPLTVPALRWLEVAALTGEAGPCAHTSLGSMVEQAGSLQREVEGAGEPQTTSEAEALAGCR